MNNQDIQDWAITAASGLQICSSIIGVWALLGALIVNYHRYYLYVNKLMIVGVASLLFGAVIPGLVNLYLEQDHEIWLGIIGWIALLAIAYGGIWGFFLPMRIAFQRRHAHIRAIIIVNLIFFLPFTWHFALWWATKPNRKKVDKQDIQSGEITEPQLLGVLDHTDKILKMLEQAGQKKACAKIRVALEKQDASHIFLVNLDQAMDRIMFDFKLPDEISDEIRGLSVQIRATQLEPEHISPTIQPESL